MIVVVISSSRRLPVRGDWIGDFSENGRNSSLSSTSPIVVLPSSEEFREDKGWYLEVFACEV